MDGLALRRGMPLADSREPAFMTLADLAALVVGFALAFALPWRYPIDKPVENRGVMNPPTWYSALFWGGEVAEKTCLALAVVALARRARYGGPCRSAEFLALACALPMLVTAVERLPGIAIWIERPGGTAPGPTPNLPIVHDEGLRLWKLALTCAAIACGLALVRYRRRLPAWATMALLGVTLMGLTFGLTHLLSGGYSRLVMAFGGDPSSLAVNIAGAFLIELPGALPFGFAGVAALFDYRRRQGPGWVWGEYLGTALAWSLALSVAAETVYSSAARHAYLDLGLCLGLFAIWALLSVVIVCWIGPAWGRWMAPLDEATPIAA